MFNLSENDVAEYWNGNASIWNDQVKKGFDLYREFINSPNIFALIGDIRGKVVLDAGCGEGYNTRKIAQQGAKITGIDISPQMIQFAKEEEQKNQLKISYHVCSFSDMKIFDDNHFDIVVSFMALMDGPNYEKAIQEIHRVLKPRGYLVFSITHPCFNTQGLSWIKNDKCEKIKVTVSNYFMKESFIEQWKFSKSPEAEQLPKFQVPRFPRTLSEYVNTLLDNGFILLRLNEPRPREEDCYRHPWLKTWRYHVAAFLHIKAQKA